MAALENPDGVNSKRFECVNDDAVVISGMSGTFPSSASVSELMDNLYNKVDMVSDEPRWDLNDLNLPKHLGKVKGLDKFDAQFFKVTYQLARVMEPLSKKLLENAFGAIFDSGTNLTSLKGKNVGVFVGASYTDFSLLLMFEINKKSNFVINGGSKAMLANRISYWIDGKGPSFCLDYGCASSTACLEKAYQSIKSGDCDAALVGGCNYCMDPVVCINMKRAGLLCMDGKTKCFDKNGDGYVRSDAVGMIFLQKAKNAKRIYAEVSHVKGLYKMKPDATFLPVRESKDIQKLLEDFYSESAIDPDCIEYIEAHGSGIAREDRNEIDAIKSFFAKNKPVNIGSIKSNMGHSDSASGICSLAKICLAYHKGKLPANLHYTEPINQEFGTLQGKVQVLTEEIPFHRGFTAMNSFSYSGANYHALLKGHYIEKNLKKYESVVPRIVLASGRQEESVDKIFNLLENQPIDYEQLALLQNVFEYDIPGHMGRGYAILDTNEYNQTVCLSKSVIYYQGEKRPLWFVFSGMGSQWAGMGTDLMKLPVFAKAIERCDRVLKPKGIDIKKILTEKDSKIFDNIINGFLGIGAIQIGLIELLKELGIVPDFIIGHSLGEMACAYQDDTFTIEEMILSTWCRGKVCLEVPTIKGGMAAVGMSYKEIINQCPPEIDVACHNSSESVTISGPVEAIKEFINHLSNLGVYCKEVQSCNMPFHSRYISAIGQKVVKDLKNILKNPKPRSSKWVSTSIPQDKWHEELAKYSSAEYHANNMMSPVLFEEVCMHIPDNAIVIEIAPHGILQAILKRSNKNCTHLALTKRGTPDGVKFILDAIGKMYQAGLNPKIDILYPKIEFPVSTETPLLSHFVQWEHSEDWPQSVSYDARDQRTAIARNFIMSIHDDDYKYLQGHIRDGVNVLPEAAIIVLVWETLAMYRNMDYRYLSVIFRDIHFYSEVSLRDDIPLKLSITINKGNDKFEVTYNETQIASGVVSGVRSIIFDRELHEVEENEDEIYLTSEDVYSILQSKGLTANDQFKSIQSSNLMCSKAKVRWTKEWVTLLDSLIQLNNLARDRDVISIPKFIQRIRINVIEHDKANVEEVEGVTCFNAQVDDIYKTTRCAGVEIESITFDEKPLKELEPDVLETSRFYSYYLMNRIDLVTSLHVILQIVYENALTNSIKLTEVTMASESKFSKIIKDVVDNTQLSIDLEAVKIENCDIKTLNSNPSGDEKTNVFVFHNLLCDETKLSNLARVISNDMFILTFEENVLQIAINTKEYFTIITSMSDGKHILVLLKKANKKRDATYIKVNYDNKFTWVPQVYAELKKTKPVILISERQPYSGLRGLVKNMRKTLSKKISAVIIEGFDAPKFNPEHIIYEEQLEKKIAINVYRKGQWGNYYHVPGSKTINSKSVTLIKPTSGSLDKLAWVETPPVQASNLLVQVCYAGISMKDAENAVKGIEENKPSFGMDFSGIDYSGERVMGVVSGGALSSSVEADPILLWPVPENWSLEDAATVPLPYLHAYYCLTQKANIRKGQTVFVTGGAGAFGQALITLCTYIGCNIYTSVSNIDKKNFLMRVFPNLNENNIDCFGRDDFHYNVIMQTKGKRCDIVINFTNGSYREAAMKCVGKNGIFIDISQHDMNENKVFGMHFLTEGKNYQTVDLSNLFKLNNEAQKKELYVMISEGISKGIVRPLTRIIYQIVDVSKAFRLISTNRNRGRVIIRMRDPVTINQGLNVMPSVTYSSQGVYVISCDGTGVSIDLADRLVKKGAAKLMINLQNSYLSGYMQSKLAQWQKYGVIIKLSFDKLYTEKGCSMMYRETLKMGEVTGIFILLQTNSKSNEYDVAQDDYVETFNKTVSVVSNLDRESRKISNRLSNFVVLSRRSNCDSVEYGVSVIENICEERNNIGLPALVLRYENLYKEQSKTSKLLPQSPIYSAMERSLKLKYKNVHTFNFKSKKEPNLRNTISNIIGAKSSRYLTEDTVIDDLNLNEINLEELKSVIKHFYKCDYSIEKIKKSSIKSLMEMNKKDTTKNINIDVVGLEKFYTAVYDESEHLAMSNCVIPMPTLLSDFNEHLNPEDTYLIVIPGFDGRYEIFSSITERLKIKAVAVHLGPDMSNKSIPNLAADVRRLMKMKLTTRSKFYLMSYSFGVNVALELAAILEEEGHVGIVYCLDSSPDALKLQVMTYLNNFTLNHLQNEIAEHICHLISEKKSDKLHNDLQSTQTWLEKVECCLKYLRTIVKYSNEYKKLILEAAYRRIILAQNYELAVKLESELVLIKANTHSKSANLTEDYNLSKYTKQPVKLFDLESDHISIINDCRVANIINQLLDPTLHLEFKNKNLCETYFV